MILCTVDFFPDLTNQNQILEKDDESNCGSDVVKAFCYNHTSTVWSSAAGKIFNYRKL